MQGREILRQFKGGNWADAALIERFVDTASGASAADMQKLLDYLQTTAAKSNPIAFRNRCRAFSALVEQSHEPAMFLPLVQALKTSVAPLRDVIAKLIPSVNNINHHPTLAKLLYVKKDTVRKAAALALAEVGGKNVLQLLSQFVNESGFPGRVEAVEVALRISGHHALPVVEEVLRRGSRGERLHALSILDDERYVTRDLRASLKVMLIPLKDEDPSIAARGILLFSSYANEGQWFHYVAPFLDSSRAQLVTAAVQGLRNYDSPRAIFALERAFRIGPNLVRMTVLETVEHIASDSVLPILIEALSSSTPGVRNRATEVLTNLSLAGVVSVYRAVIWLLRNPEPSVRRMAIEIANRVGDPSGDLWPKLLRFLKDEDWWVRERVADALVEMAGTKLSRHIVPYLKDPSDTVRRFAINILRRLKDPETLGALVRCAQKDEDWWAREQAIETCGEMGDERAIPYLIDLMNKTPELRLACLAALRSLGAKDAADYVARLLTEDVPIDVQLAALRCLEKLNDPTQASAVAQRSDDAHREVRDLARLLLKRWGSDVVDNTMRTIEQTMGRMELLLYGAVEAGADDLLLAADRPPYIKKTGQLSLMSPEPIPGEELESFLHSKLTEEQRASLSALKDVDFSYEVKSQGLRFRANIFRQNTGISAVFRVVSDKVPNADDLGLPKVILELSDLKEGLILVGGPTGSGKSTTLAALLDRINRTSARHIITLEDPIEVVHKHRRSLITQRELGTHSRSYASALRATLREDPDVILVGEARDLETISFAITAAETGHLVFATVHTVSADKSVDRVINAFPAGQQPQVRSMLAGSLRAVICQQLLRRLDRKGRVVAVEVMINTEAVANLIRKSNTFQIPAVITTSRQLGMQSMDLELQRLLYDEIVSAEEAYAKAINKDEFASLIQNKPDKS